jgi:hypothetical protein
MSFILSFPAMEPLIWPLASGHGGRFSPDSDHSQLGDALFRPKEHHVFDVLHWVKKGFKRDALDALQEHDAFNKEAFR